jgi:hypothetical protein
MGEFSNLPRVQEIVRMSVSQARRLIGAYSHYLMLSFSMSGSANRWAMKTLVATTRNVPKDFFEYDRYGIYVGRK